MMNRREFVKYLALVAAGASALPKQLAAFELYYEVNTPLTDRHLVAIDEVMVCGTATHSMPVQANFWSGDQLVLPLAVNLFGGIIRWAATPTQVIVADGDKFRWQFRMENPGETLMSPNAEAELLIFQNRFKRLVNGQITWVDQNAKRHYHQFTDPEASLGHAWLS